ncbi:Kunitz/Bovine pancreatic trypsin inhibitor domain protein [Ancylostoma ceylanicum]|uniref:Kunitz/Bovine pancreatic trypsin inhibitor domain protein n=1 Tax=Ancylostoma ceylanicum TaxID=53326 RepID=A0A0D6LF75_9BILA|nr:Kunitz/Bovine pancreatic trypsin inhibitor domain protein [Ancylostoma ceylanicum]
MFDPVVMTSVRCYCCLEPYSAGYGHALLLRFYFDVASRQCKPFVYRGAGGFGNVFESKQICQSQCQNESGGAISHRLYDNYTSSESPNPCAVSTGPSLTQCTPGVSTCGSGSFCHVGATPQTTTCCPKPAPIDRCQQPLNVGVGNANLQRLVMSKPCAQSYLRQYLP